MNWLKLNDGTSSLKAEFNPVIRSKTESTHHKKTFEKSSKVFILKIVFDYR